MDFIHARSNGNGRQTPRMYDEYPVRRVPITQQLFVVETTGDCGRSREARIVHLVVFGQFPVYLR